jgi:hypothetical protein
VNGMLSLDLAGQLKAAGFSWTPHENDFFAIPDRGMDDKVFVISDMIVLLEIIKGQLAVTFHGSAEWALDHIVIAELIWLPTETQLRTALEERLMGETQPVLALTSTRAGYRCDIQFRGAPLVFEAFGASEAYAEALLHVLSQTKQV